MVKRKKNRNERISRKRLSRKKLSRKRLSRKRLSRKKHSRKRLSRKIKMIGGGTYAYIESKNPGKPVRVFSPYEPDIVIHELEDGIIVDKITIDEYNAGHSPENRIKPSVFNSMQYGRSLVVYYFDEISMRDRHGCVGTKHLNNIPSGYNITSDHIGQNFNTMMAPAPAPAPASALAPAPAPAPAPALEPVVSGIKGIIRNAHRNEDGTPKHKTRFLDISNGEVTRELDDDTPIEIYKVDEYKHIGGIINIDMDGLQIVKVRNTDDWGAVGTQHIKLV